MPKAGWLLTEVVGWLLTEAAGMFIKVAGMFIKEVGPKGVLRRPIRAKAWVFQVISYHPPLPLRKLYPSWVSYSGPFFPNLPLHQSR